MSGTKELTIRPHHHPCCRLLASGEGKAVGSQPPTQFRAGGHVGTCGTDILADKGEVYPGPFCCLMLDRGKGGRRPLAFTQMDGQLVGYLCLALSSKGGEDGQIMRPGDDGMAQQDFSLAGDLLMPGMIEARR
ncbi:hypothetical protein [Devosia naphthalenivorans]|uniref:hypothetical protein n=1 Tax=Devosia naphthalenivorans TaxID=2082392 RepID=UPI000D38B197|nr:hypothetical protein [Devosia naphthalenivorans]